MSRATETVPNVTGHHFHDVFAPSYSLMRVATEEFFFCYAFLLLLNWSWSWSFGLVSIAVKFNCTLRYIMLFSGGLRRINDFNKFDRHARHLYARDRRTHETDYLD